MKRTMLMLLLLLCLLTASGGHAQTHLMVATDLHYIVPSLYENSDSLRVSATYGDGKMPHHSDAWLDAFVREALDRAPDAVLLLGDQSYNGEVLSHRAISDRLAEIQAAGIAVYVIPGNHDINNDNAFEYGAEKTVAIHSIPVSRYEKYYAAYGLEQSFSRDDASFSYAVSLRDDLWLIMLDAGIYEPYAEPFGLLSDTTRQWLRGLLAQAEAAGIQVITSSHQSMLPHSNLLTGGYMVINWEDISALLAEHGVRLHLSGHLHVQHIAQSGAFTDVALSSLSNQPNQFAMITIADDGGIALQMESLNPSFLPEGLAAEGISFFRAASHGKALSALRDSGIDDATKEKMADYAAWVNQHYYAGSVATIREEALHHPAYALWQSLGEGTFWQAYLADMLTGDPADMRTLTLPAFDGVPKTSTGAGT